VHLHAIEHLTRVSQNRNSFPFCKSKKVLFEKPRGPLGGADLRFSSPQPDTILHCETTDTGLVHRVVCLFTPQPLGQYQIILLGELGTEILITCPRLLGQVINISVPNSNTTRTLDLMVTDPMLNCLVFRFLIWSCNCYSLICKCDTLVVLEVASVI